MVREYTPEQRERKRAYWRDYYKRIRKPPRAKSFYSDITQTKIDELSYAISRYRFRPAKIASGVDPTIVALWKIMADRKCSAPILAIISGVGKTTIRGWTTNRKQPHIGNLQACFNALGYDLVPVKREEPYAKAAHQSLDT